MTESLLDRDETYAELDSEGLLDRIAALPEQMAEAHAAAAAFAATLPPAHRSCSEIVIAGMGGSGIGGQLLQALARDLGARTPVTLVRGYRMPAHVGAHTLVIASSNSGNTEETVAAFGEAIGAGAACVAVTTGGALLALARQKDQPALTFTWDAEPRSALGWSFASLLAICGALEMLPDLSADLPIALDEMRALGREIARDVPERDNAAKQMARRLHKTLPVFIGAESLAPVAYRWRTQVNENAKSWAVADELPEMNHNAQTGYGLASDVVPLLRPVLLRHASVHPRIALRFDATADEMRAHGVQVEMLDIDGTTLLAQTLRAVLLGDYVSFYLGLLNGVHPSPVAALGRLKDLLASQPGQP